MNLTSDQIKRAAALLDHLARQDKEISALAGATEVTAYARSGGNPVAEFKRMRGNGAWPDEHASALHSFLLGRYRSARARTVRELHQLDVAIPQASQ